MSDLSSKWPADSSDESVRGIDCLRRAGDSEFPPLHERSAVAPVAPDAFGAVYDLMFEMVEMLVSRTGHLKQELVGFEFEGDAPMPARAVRVGQSDALHRLMEQMLSRWPVVAHIFQGWSLPDASSSGYQHIRCEVIVIALHTHERACVSTCKVLRVAAGPDAAGEDGGGAESLRVEKGKLRNIPAAGDARL